MWVQQLYGVGRGVGPNSGILLVVCAAGVAYPVGGIPKPEGSVGLHVASLGAHIGLVGGFGFV